MTPLPETNPVPSPDIDSDHDRPKDGERGFIPVLKNRNFLTLWGGQVFSQIADKVYLVMAIALVANQFQAEGQSISGWVSAITIAFTIPAVLFGFIAGVMVDRWHKKDVLINSNVLRGLFVLILPILVWLTEGQSLWGEIPLGFIMLLIVTLLVSTLTQFFAPAEQAAIPLLVQRRHLLSANSLYTTTMMASVIIGFAVGEPVLAFANQLLGDLNYSEELVVGGSYVVSGLLLMLMQIRERIDIKERAKTKVWQDLKTGLAVLRDQPRVRSALIQLIILFCAFAALAVLAVRVAEIMPELRAEQFGFLLAANGVGMAIGAAVVGQIGSNFVPRRLNLYGSIGVALCLGGLSFYSSQLIPCLIVITLLGFCAAWVGIPMQTIIQAETPEEQRGKVFGLQNNAVNIALTLPLALASIAEAQFGLAPVLQSLGVIVALGGLITWYIADKSSPSRQSKSPR